MERKPGVAGGSKWTYEVTFPIAMKGGREYYTAAAQSYKTFLLIKLLFFSKLECLFQEFIIVQT